jgi:hypothetical protein
VVQRGAGADETRTITPHKAPAGDVQVALL